MKAKNNLGDTPLHKVAGNPKTAELLIAAGADVKAKNDRGDTPLHKFATAVKTAELLIATGADVNAKNNQGQTVLHLLVAESGYYRLHMVKQLIAKGANLNARDRQGNTPLTIAIQGRSTIESKHWQEKQSETIELLKSHGARE